MGLSGGQGCTHKSISLYCFCWGLGACIHQTKYYPSVFTISLSQTFFPSFKTLRFAVFIPLFSFLSAFIKSASSLRKNLVFHSMCEVWPWSCLDPGTATDHLQPCMCCREHKLTVLGHFCELYPCRQGVRTYTWFQAKSDPYTEDYIRKKR